MTAPKFSESSYLLGSHIARLMIAEDALRSVVPFNKGEEMLRADALQTIDALRERICHRLKGTDP